MAQLKVPEQPRVQTIAYDNLLGVDYQSDQTEINRRRSPDMVNMISDLGGNPVKRYGYRNVGGNQMFDLIVEVGGTTYGIVVGRATHLYELTFNDDGTITLTDKLYTTTFEGYDGNVDVLTAFGRIYMFGGDRWCSFDPTAAQEGHHVAGETKVGTPYLYHTGTFGDNVHLYASLPNDESIIPTVYTMFKPNGAEMVSLPAGTDISGATQGVNLLTPYRRVEYCVQTDTVSEGSFYLPNGQVAGADAKVEILDKNTLEWVEASSAHILTASSIYSSELSPVGYVPKPSDPTQHYPWMVIRGIEFSPSPPYASVSDGGGVSHLEFRNSDGTASGVRVPAGVPNVRITYAPFDMTVVGTDGGYNVTNGIYRELRAKLLASTARTIYDGRLWIAVGNRVYYSRVNEPFRIDDDYYIEVDSPVKSLAQTSGGLAIIGEGSHPIYIASGSFNESYNAPVYSVKASNADISPTATGNQLIFNDEPIIFTQDGIYGLTSNYYSDKYSIMRSGKINRHLCAEPEYSNAVAAVYKNYLWVAVGTHMYVLDGRHKDSSRNGDNSYECYYFEDMPEIKRIWVANNRMLFSDGAAIYTWNDDLEAKLQYRDLIEWDDDESRWVNGKPVKAKWTSLLDGDSAPHYYKTLQKKGTMVTVAPPMQTSCQITLVRDAHDSIYVGRFNGGTFALTDAVLDAFTKKKVKKYKRLQFVIENNEAEPFGIISVVKSYILNNYAKR